MTDDILLLLRGCGPHPFTISSPDSKVLPYDVVYLIRNIAAVHGELMAFDVTHLAKEWSCKRRTRE